MNVRFKVDHQNPDFTVVTVKDKQLDNNSLRGKFFEDKFVVPLNENSKYIVLHSEIPLNVYRTETANEAVYTFKSNLTLFSGRGEGRKPAKSISTESNRNKDIQQESHQSRRNEDSRQESHEQDQNLYEYNQHVANEDNQQTAGEQNPQFADQNNQQGHDVESGGQERGAQSIIATPLVNAQYAISEDQQRKIHAPATDDGWSQNQ